MHEKKSATEYDIVIFNLSRTSVLKLSNANVSASVSRGLKLSSDIGRQR